MKIFFLFLVLFSISCSPAKKAINSAVKFSNYKALYFEINALNTTDSTIMVEYPKFNCPDFWIRNSIGVVEKIKEDTLKLNYADCAVTIDPDTYEIEERREEVKPNESYTYKINLSRLIVTPTLPPGNYQIVIKLYDWDFMDTTFVQDFVVEQKLFLRKAFDDNHTAYNTLVVLQELSSMTKGVELYAGSSLERLAKNLKRQGFFKHIKANRFASSHLQNRFDRFSKNLLENAKKKVIKDSIFENIKKEAKFFHRKLKRKYIREIPNFKATLKTGEDINSLN